MIDEGEDQGINLDLGSNLPVEGPKTKAKKKPVGMPETVKIILEENDDIPPTGLFIGHNGDSFLIQPGVPVDVPARVLNVLDSAVMSSPIIDPNTLSVTGYREKMRYPYRYVK